MEQMNNNRISVSFNVDLGIAFISVNGTVSLKKTLETIFQIHSIGKIIAIESEHF